MPASVANHIIRKGAKGNTAPGRECRHTRNPIAATGGATRPARRASRRPHRDRLLRNRAAFPGTTQQVRASSWIVWFHAPLLLVLCRYPLYAKRPPNATVSV